MAITLSDIDTSRAMRTDDELRMLVEAIHGSAPGTQETNWVEWKNGLDLTKAAGRFAVSKAILGFANRSVEQAQLACEGVAYMVVGVEPGAAAGVGAADHAELGQAIKTYVDGARWTPFYVPFEGVTVLVIVIEAPRAGDPIHTLQKTYNDGAKYNAAAGTVFHRGTAHTEPAGTGEIEMLSRRLVRGMQKPELDLVLRGTADPLTRISVEQEELEDWLRRREAFIRANSGRPPDRPAPPARRAGPPGLAGMSTFDLAGSIGALGLGSLFADPKDAKEFENRVSDYLVKMRNRLLDHVVRNIVLDDDANTVHFMVGNETDDPVSGMQLTVRIPKSGLLVYTSPPRVDDLPPRPKWPDFLDSMRENAYAGITRAQVPDFFPHGGAVEEKGDVFEVTWDVGDLRPHQEADGYTITVVAGPNAPDQLPVEMIARAMDRRGTRTKIEQLTVATETWTIDDFYDAEPPG
ncbi:hypothetical protein ABFW14_10060 [Mycolicibacterium fortuitum]